MSRNGKSRGKGFAYKDLSDENSEGSDVDGVALVMTDSDSSRGGSTRRKYVVSEDDDGKLSSICKPQKLTRNERVCVIVGGLIIAAVLVLLVAVIVITQVSSPQRAGGGEGTMQAGNSTITPWGSVRLPDDVTPSHYDVNLNVNLETFSVAGSINITCTVKSETSYVLVHAKDMDIGPEVHVQTQDLSAVQSAGKFQLENEFYVLELSTKLQPGTVYIHLPFSYTLRDDLSGFYKSSYVNNLGQERFLATTQFEPTDARKAFPCFDEPALKANFTMHITHDSTRHAVSNMPLESVTANSDGTMTTHFETSVRMSTYLVAFIVSDFICVNDSITEGRERPLKVKWGGECM